MSVKFEIRKRKLQTCSSHCCGARHGQHLHRQQNTIPPHEFNVTTCEGFSRVDLGQEQDDLVEEAEESPRHKNPRLLLEDHKAKSRRLREEGNVLAEAGSFRAAMSRWREALDVDSENALLYELMAQASMQLDEDFQAIQYATHATKFAPDWADGFLTLSRSHFNYGELQLALESLDKAVALGVEDDLTQERAEIVALLAKQQEILETKQAELEQTHDPDHAQVICCMKHLSLRAKPLPDTHSNSSSELPSAEAGQLPSSPEEHE